MTRATLLWVRRGGIGVALLGGIAVVLVAVFSRSHWTVGLGIALEWANGSTVLLSPLAGSVAAFVVWRNYPRDLQEVTRTTNRGARTVVHIAIATWLAMCVAWLVGVVSVVLGVWVGGGLFEAQDPWVLVAGPVVIYAAVALGLALAVVFRSLVTAPVAGLLVYALVIWTYSVHMPSFLAVGGPTGTLVEIRPIPEVVVATVLLNLAAGVGLTYFAWRVAEVRHRRPLPADLIGALALATVVVVLGAFAQRDERDTHYVDAPAYACAGVEPTVCVNSRGPLDVESVAKQFDDAHAALAAAALNLPDRYMEIGGDSASGVVLVTEPADDGKLTRFDLAMSLARPAQCGEYLAELPPDNALAAQLSLGYWVDLTMSPTAAARWNDVFGDLDQETVSAWARQAYAALVACDLSSPVLDGAPVVEAVDWW